METATAARPEGRCVARYLHMSPFKVRIVINRIRGKPVAEAFRILRFTPRRAAKAVEKALRSAVANATNNFDLDEGRLYVAEIYADGGPVMKRYQPRARGQAYPIRKRTSHLTVAVREREEG